MFRKRSTFLVLMAFAALSAGPGARAATVDREPVAAARVRRFSVPVVSGLAGGPDGRLYALASDHLTDGSRMPRSFWWTRSPGGRRWTLIAGQPSAYDPWLLAPDPVHPGVVYAADDVGTVLRSEDAGGHWETRGSVPGTPLQLLATATGLLIVGESCAPCRSSDGGRTWVQETSGVGRLVPAPGDSRVFYSFWPTGILRSTDGARSFQDVSPGVLEGASALAVAPSDADVVYALPPAPATPLLNRTTDGGASWTRLRLPAPERIWSGLAVDPASAPHLFVLGGPPASRRLFESFDGGGSWTAHAGRVDATELRVANVAGGLEVEAFGRRGLFASDDRGEHWASADSGITADAELLLAGARNGDLYLVVEEGGGAWRSRDTGRTWEYRGSLPGSRQSGYASLDVDPFDAAKLLVFDGYGYGFWWSDDAGRNWSFRKGPRSRTGSSFIDSVVFDPHRRNTVYASTTEDAWRSSDRGFTWSRFTASMPPGTDCNHSGCFDVRDVEEIVPDPFDPERFYAVAHTYGSFRTTDGGATWKALTAPALAAIESPRMRPDPLVGGRLYWGLDIETQVYQSDRAGQPPWRTLLRTGLIGPIGNDDWLTFDPRGRLVVQPEIHTARILRRLGEDTWERIPVALEHQEDVRLLDPLVPAPGGGARMFLLVPGLGLFRADLPEP